MGSWSSSVVVQGDASWLWPRGGFGGRRSHWGGEAFSAGRGSQIQLRQHAGCGAGREHFWKSAESWEKAGLVANHGDFWTEWWRIRDTWFSELGMMFPVSGAMIRWYLMVFNVIQWDEKSLAMSGVKYPLVNKHNYWKGPLQWIYPLKMVIFHTYVNVYQRVSNLNDWNKWPWNLRQRCLGLKQTTLGFMARKWTYSRTNHRRLKQHVWELEFREENWWLPFGKQPHNYGKSPCY